MAARTVDVDVAVVGGGIVGMATAVALTEARPGADVLVLEKEARWAAHQTGHNSGVIHSGVYYPPGSQKARYARAGARETVAFCRAERLPVEVCGKVIVAGDAAEVSRLEALAERGRANGVTVTRLGPAGIRDQEPHARGRAGLHVAETGICDYAAVTRRLAAIAERAGATLRAGTEVVALDAGGAAPVTLRLRSGEAVTARRVVVCAGLAAGRLARGPLPARVVPFRGEYYELVPTRRDLVRHLIYPVPDPAFPFLGVHLTRMVDGSVHAGPNAVLALRREGYRRTSFSVADTAATLGYAGFRRLARRHWRPGAAEVARSLSRRRFAAAVAGLVPEIGPADLRPVGAGVRAQAVGPDGSLVDDFLFVADGPVLHVLNAPSPAATAALPIGRELAARVLAIA